MTELPTYAPGLAASSSEDFTQLNAVLAGKAPSMQSYGVTFNDLDQYTLIGRITETGELVLSDPGANDGSQIPIGVTTHAVTVSDSNSIVPDSNSLLGLSANVGYYLDGAWNFDRLTKHANWTLDTLRRVLEANGRSLTVDVIQTGTPSVQ